jgi:hypothetical protein
MIEHPVPALQTAAWPLLPQALKEEAVYLEPNYYL